MIAMVPMTLRGATKGDDVGNQVGATAISVHTDIEEPIDRLRAIVRDAQSAKALTDAIGKELVRDLLEYAPTIVANPLLRNVKLPGLSLVVSNVRGPYVPLYMAGARLVKYAPVSIIVDGTGLNITGISYAGSMWICAISCREMMPDPAFFADCLLTSFAQMKEAAAREVAFNTANAAEATMSAGADAAKSARRRKTAPKPPGIVRTVKVKRAAAAPKRKTKSAGSPLNGKAARASAVES